MKTFSKLGFFALLVSMMASCTPDQPVADGKPTGIDSLEKAKVEVPGDSSKASIEELDTNASAKESGKGE